MAEEAETKSQADAAAALIILTDYVRQAGDTLPLNKIEVVHSICDSLCQILKTDRDRFADLAMNVARRYAGEIYASGINLTYILLRQESSTPITPFQLPEGGLAAVRIVVDSADFRGRLEKLCELYSFEIKVQNTNPAPKG